MSTVNTPWRPGPLIVSFVLGLCLFATYFAPITSGWWHVLDVHTAYALNSWVAHSSDQQWLWAFGNVRSFDFLVALVMLGVLVHYVLAGRCYRPSYRGAQAIVICLLLIVLVATTRDLLFKHVRHDSPSLVLHSLTLLADKTSLNPKDASHRSFPGDHATVVATFVYLLWFFAGRRYGLAALAIALVAVLPRLVAGAHWLTDDLVGGLGTALVTVPLVIYTPIGVWLVSRLAPWLRRSPSGTDRKQRADGEPARR